MPICFDYYRSNWYLRSRSKIELYCLQNERVGDFVHVCSKCMRLISAAGSNSQLVLLRLEQPFLNELIRSSESIWKLREKNVF